MTNSLEQTDLNLVLIYQAANTHTHFMTNGNAYTPSVVQTLVSPTGLKLAVIRI